jgi:hypothetical protein
MFGAYFNSVVQGVGKEQAFALLSESLGNAGAASGKMAKEQMGIEELDVKTTSSFIRGMYESLGVSIEIEEEPTKVLFKNGRCPVYEGLKGVGYSAQDIEAFCREGPAVMMNSLFEQLDPNVTYKFTKFRESPDDICEEEVVIKK